jgi:hypothetical protein
MSSRIAAGSTGDDPRRRQCRRPGGIQHGKVTRAVAASRVPMLVAIGHEIDVSLAELAADKRASTPSNAAELLTPDKRTELQDLRDARRRCMTRSPATSRVSGRSEDMACRCCRNGRALDRSPEDATSPSHASCWKCSVRRLRSSADMQSCGGQENGVIVRTAKDAPAGAIVHIDIDGDRLEAEIVEHD